MKAHGNGDVGEWQIQDAAPPHRILYERKMKIEQDPAIASALASHSGFTAFKAETLKSTKLHGASEMQTTVSNAATRITVRTNTSAGLGFKNSQTLNMNNRYVVFIEIIRIRMGFWGLI